MASIVQGNIDVNISADTIKAQKEIQDLCNSVTELVKMEEAAKDLKINMGVAVPDGAFAGVFDEATDKINGTANNAKESLNDLGEQSIYTNDNINKLAAGLLNMASTGNVSANSISALARSLGVGAVEIGAFVALLTVGIKEAKESVEAFKSLASFVGDGISSAVDISIEAFNDFIDILETTISEIKEFSEYGVELQNTFTSMYTVIGNDAGNEVIGFTEKLQELYGLDSSSLLMDMNDLINAAGSMGLSGDGLVNATKNMTLMAEDLSVVAGTFEKASGDIAQAVSKGFVGRNSSLYILLTKNEKDELKELNSEYERYAYIMNMQDRIRGRYLDYLDTEAGKISLLKQQYSALMNNIGTIALKLYATVAPVLTKLLQIVNTLLTGLMKFLHIDIKSSTLNDNESIADNITTKLENATEAAKETNKAIKEIKRTTLSFDDVIQINDTKDKEDSLKEDLEDLTGIKAPDYTWLDDMGESVDGTKSKWQAFIEELRRLIEQGEFGKAGRLISDYFKEWLQGINWDDIKDKAEEFGAGIATLLNGLFYDAELGKEVGRALAESFNTIFYAIHGFLFGTLDNPDGFDFEQFGIWLGTAWHSFWENFDAKLLADDLYGLFMGAVDLVSGFLSNASLSDATDKIAETIIKFFDNFSDDDIIKTANTIIDFIDSVFKAVSNMMSKLEEHPEIKEKINLLIENLIKGLQENSGSWGNTLNKLISGLLTLLSDTIENADTSGLSKAIETFLDNLKPAELIWEYIMLKMKAKNELFESCGDQVILAIGAGMAGGMASLLQTILLILNQLSKTLITTVLSLADQIIQLLFTIFSMLIALLGYLTGKLFIKLGIYTDEDFETFFKPVLESTVNFIAAIPNKVKKLASDIGAKFLEGLISGIAKIKSWFSKDSNKLDVEGMMLKNGNKRLNTNVKWSSSVGIPKLANGGIVNQSTLANIGEAGQEAVLPLENNTGWMNDLADKIANKINSAGSGGNGGNVTIDMSGYQKNFYTRSEMMAFAEQVVAALNIYGIKIAVVS